MVETILLYFIKFFILLLVILWIIIGVNLIYRKYRLKHLGKIEATFALLAAQYLYPKEEEPFNLINVQRKFKKLGIVESKPRNVQYLIDLMIRTQRSLLGSNYYKLGEFFKKIPPYRFSLTKLNSKKWYIKGRGIRELYEMDQVQYIKPIFKELNNKNIYVRREAQIAIVVFWGWESLRFLSHLKKEMSLWQQIKVVEKLHDLYPVPNLKYLRKGYNNEKPYAIELLMRIIRKFRLIEEVGYILKFINANNFDTRETAIYCIRSFNLNEKELNILKYKFIHIPNTEQQIQLLKYMDRTAESPDLDFYKLLLYTGNDIIKLTTAEILWNRGEKEMVQEFYYQQYDAAQTEKVPAA